MIFLFRKLGWLLRRRGREAELEEELRSHLDEETEEGQAAGLSREEAARRAHLELGNVTLLKEDTRATWSWRLWDELVRDVRSAAGLLTRDIRVSIVILCTLALGISANTAVFSTVRGVLLKPLPMPNADRLVLINETRLPEFPEFPTASGNFLAWQQQSASFENMAALVNQRLTLLEEGKPESLEGALVTASFFPTVGIRLVLGRVFSPDEDHPGKSDVVVVSARLWARRFRSDPNIIGRVVNIDSRLRSVIGVVAIDLEDTDLWVPMAFDVAARDNHGGHDLITFGLLKRGTSIEAAATDLKGIARQLEASHPDTNQGWSVLLTPMRELVVGDVRPMLLLLWGVVSLVLLIMCANIANLLLIRSISRRRDVAIRLAIGATRLQIMRQLLAESVSLALLGGGAGILFEAVKQLQVDEASPYSILAIPLLGTDSAYTTIIDRVLVIDCDEATQIQRVQQRSNLEEEQIKRIMKAQMPRQTRLAMADDIIENDGNIKELQHKIKQLHQKYTKTCIPDKTIP